jgi:hypothetical protein
MPAIDKTQGDNMILPTNWLDKPHDCDCCGDTYKIGYLIAVDGDNICEDCFDVIEIAEQDENK